MSRAAERGTEVVGGRRKQYGCSKVAGAGAGGWSEMMGGAMEEGGGGEGGGAGGLNRVGENCVARHLQESLHSQLLQQLHRQAAVQVLGRQLGHTIWALLLLQGCLKLGSTLSRHHIPAPHAELVMHTLHTS